MLSFQFFSRDFLFSQKEPAQPTLMLNGGEQICFRPIRANDGGTIEAVYSTLSAQSKYMRFGTSLSTVAPYFLNQLAQQIALKAASSGYGLLAFDQDDCPQNGPQPIGIGCYIESGDGIAELELTVVDAWQGKGIGSRLLERLIEQARKGGYTLLEAYMNTQNRPMQALIERAYVHHQLKPYGSIDRYRLLVNNPKSKQAMLKRVG